MVVGLWAESSVGPCYPLLSYAPSIRVATKRLVAVRRSRLPKPRRYPMETFWTGVFFGMVLMSVLLRPYIS